jgi:hypothetical protein
VIFEPPASGFRGDQSTALTQVIALSDHVPAL